MKSFRFMTSMLTLIALAGLLSSCGTDSTPTAPGSSLDSTAPPAPSNLAQTNDPASGAAQLEWSASPAGDVAGYQVFEFDPSPERENSYVQVGETAAGVTTWTLPQTFSFATTYLRVRAVDVSGNRSALSADFAARLGPSNPTGGSSGDTDLPEPGTP